MIDEDFKPSECLGGYLHRFNIVGEYPEGVLEVCEICGTDKFFRVIDDKLENNEYMQYHLRLAIPPYHPLYNHEHPRATGILSPIQR